MNTTGPVMTVTDELLAELETHYRSVNDDSRALLITELRRLRAENAELGGLLREAGKTIRQLQSEQPTPLRIARYLDAMRAKIDAAMRATQ